MRKIKNVIQFIIALNLMGLGINLFLLANLGLGSWDILNYNLYKQFGITFGTWVMVVGIVVIIISQFLYFNLSHFLSIITGLLLGEIIDVWLYNVFTFSVNALWLQIIILCLSVILLGIGISLLVSSKLPPTPGDILMLSLMHRFKWSFKIAKTVSEIVVFTSAIIIGYINGNAFSEFGVGTIINMFLIGIVIEYANKLRKYTIKKYI